MKKIILTGAALMAFAAAGFAQSSPNSATLNQNGTSQTAEQTQTGSGHQSTISQDKRTGSFNFGNYGFTNQTVTNNTAIINQNQNAHTNRGGITQGGGSGNTATIQQNINSGTSGGSPGNAATLSQSDIKGAGGNWADVNQNGNGHNATVSQQGTASGAPSSANTALVQQQGSLQTGTINQNAGSQGNSTDNTGDLKQFGSANIGTINQNERSTNNTATVTQYGVDGGDADATANTARVDQDGSQKASTNNRATIIQGASGNAYDGNQAYSAQRGNNNEVTIRQINGNENRAGLATTGESPVIQVGDNNITTIDQIGNRNTANVIEAFGDNNRIDVDQNSSGFGTGNTASVSMQPNNGAGNNNNSIKIDQTGSINFGGLDLRAANSTLPLTPNFSITQNGRSNWARLKVRNQANSNSGTPGMNNTLNVQQTSASNATNGQTFNGGVQGSENDITVTQSGGDNNTIGNDSQNDRGLRIIGDDNTVGLTQNGNNNQMNLRIQGGTSGNGNTLTINQAGDNNRVGTGFLADTSPNTVDNTSALGLFVSGNGNNLNISQNGGDEVKATQDGNDELTVRQQGAGTSVSVQNRVLINQAGGTGKQVATIEQNGDQNFVHGLGGATTFATQSGAGTNTLNVTQTNLTPGAGANNALVGQTGVGNLINITQSK